MQALLGNTRADIIARQAVRLCAGLLLLVAMVACGSSESPASPVSPGELAVTVTGLPGGVAADIQVEAPDGTETSVTETETLSDLSPGTYTVTAAPVTHADQEFTVESVNPASVTVSADTKAATTVTYQARPGFIIGPEYDAITVPFDQQQTLEFALTPEIGFSSEVDVTLTAPAGIDVSPATFQLTSAVPVFTVAIAETSTAAGTHELTYTATSTDCGCPPVSGTVTIDTAAIVTTLDDTSASPQAGSLRYYLELPRAEAIIFAPQLYSGGTATITLEDSLEIDRDVTITGPANTASGPQVILDGDSAVSPISVIGDAEVQLENLFIMNGLASIGGGLFADLDTVVYLSGVWFSNNYATASGGAIHNAGTMEITNESLILTNTADVNGGGIWNTGQILITGSHIEDNHANNYGGGIATMGASSWAVLTGGAQIVDNQAGVRGGGVYQQSGTLEITGSAVTANTSLQNGGGIMAFGNSSRLTIDDSEIVKNTARDGAGVHSYATSSVINSRIVENIADDNGGGVRNHFVMEISAGTEVKSNKAGADYGGVFNDGIITIKDSLIEDNTAGGNGAGFFNGWAGSDAFPDGTAKSAHVERTMIHDNRSEGDGGGIYSIRRLVVVDSHITRNTAAGSGGGIHALSILNSGAPANNGGQLEVSGTTIEGNRAGNDGGGIYSYMIHQSGPATAPNAPFTLLNSTIVRNFAQNHGGGIFLVGDNDADAALFFNTIVRNDADGSGGGVYVNRPDVTIQANLMLLNTSLPGASHNDLVAGAGQVTSGGYNFLSQIPLGVAGMATDRARRAVPVIAEVEDALPGHPALADNGGPTLTIALPDDIAAASWVAAAECIDPTGSALTTDQRGERRPVAGTCSIGAYQTQGTP